MLQDQEYETKITNNIVKNKTMTRRKNTEVAMQRQKINKTKMKVVEKKE
jgi:hypothetical protein